MLPHETIQELLAGYALDALSDDEARSVEAHLPSCEECRRTLAEYRRVTEELAVLASPREAPPHLEADLRARLAVARKSKPQARTARQVHHWRRFALAAAVALALGLGMWLARFGMPALGGSTIETQEAQAILTSDTALRVALVPEDTAPDATGEFVLGDDGRTAVIVVNGLPRLPADQVYQLWLVAGDRRDDAGTYQSAERIWLVRAPQDLSNYEALGVTIEPLGGSPAPTGLRVLSASLSVGP